jgi:putative serine/threonine protein kinase
MQSERANLEDLTRTPYIQVLTYPRISLREARSRISQLRQLGVDELVFEGRAKVGRLGILGLGTVGIVVRAEAKGRLCALKIRRTDANRSSMEEEYRITALANRVGIGPDVYSHTRDMILMKLLESQEIAEWLKGLHGKGSREQARMMVHSLLNQCRKLDIMGIDHGQLSNLRKHAVIAEGAPWIIDFESAGTERKAKNVTTAAQYLLVGGGLSPAMRRALGVRDTATLKGLLADYKKGLSDYAYSKILEHLRLASPDVHFQGPPSPI